MAAINSVGTGNQSAASNAVTPATVPGAPTITATVPANTSVAITWTAPASNGGSAITGYVVTPYIGGVAQATQTFNSTATTETATGLTNGTAYTFKVAAINSVGTGAQSAASATATPATVPGAPTIGTATAGVGSATVTWTAPASNGGAAITGYTVTPYKAGVAQAIQNFSSTATTETVTGLANNTAYTFAVAAVNGMGTGINSAQSNSVTTPTTPGTPTIGTATAGVGSATVTWTAPASNGGTAITGYVITPYKAGVAQATQTFNSTATTETATGLANNTAYTFAVAAINGVGTGAASAQSNSVTTPTTPGAPTIGTATRGNASVSRELDGPGHQRRCGHHRLRGHPLHRRRGPGHPDLQHDGHHRQCHRADQRHRLHLQGGRHQRGRHRGRSQRRPPRSPRPRRRVRRRACRVRSATLRCPSAGPPLPATAVRPSPATWSPPTSAAWPRPPRPSTRLPPPRRLPG